LRPIRIANSEKHCAKVDVVVSENTPVHPVSGHSHLTRPSRVGVRIREIEL